MRKCDSLGSAGFSEGRKGILGIDLVTGSKKIRKCADRIDDALKELEKFGIYSQVAISAVKGLLSTNRENLDRNRNTLVNQAIIILDHLKMDNVPLGLDTTEMKEILPYLHNIGSTDNNDNAKIFMNAVTKALYDVGLADHNELIIPEIAIEYYKTNRKLPTGGSKTVLNETLENDIREAAAGAAKAIDSTADTIMAPGSFSRRMGSLIELLQIEGEAFRLGIYERGNERYAERLEEVKQAWQELVQLRTASEPDIPIAGQSYHQGGDTCEAINVLGKKMQELLKETDGKTRPAPPITPRGTDGRGVRQQQ